MSEEQAKPGDPEPSSDRAPTPPAVSDNMVKLYSIADRERTTRWLIVAIAVVVGVLIITIGAVLMMNAPSWETIVITIVVNLIGPAGILRMVIKERRRAVDKQHRRVVKLEKLLDPERTSSDPNEGGDS